MTNVGQNALALLIIIAFFFFVYHSMKGGKLKENITEIFNKIKGE